MTAPTLEERPGEGQADLKERVGAGADRALIFCRYSSSGLPVMAW
jgi:hypothetical protein